MSKSLSEMPKESEMPTKMTKEEVVEYLSEIEAKLTESDTTSIHTLVALNQMLRIDNADKVFKGELKDRAKDIWMKLKARGIDLTEPPTLFGLPNFKSE